MDAFLNGGADYLGTVLNIAFYGLHAGIFFLFLGIHRYRGTKAFSGLANISSSLTFACGTAVVVVDVWSVYFELTGQLDAKQVQLTRLNFAYSVFYALIDFIAQWLLIYRCWIIWNKLSFIVVLPTALAIASFWCNIVEVIIPATQNPTTIKLSKLLNIATASIAASMAVNSIVTITIVSRIWILSRRFLKDAPRVGDGPYTIVIAMLLESGVSIFLAQVLFLVLYVTQSNGYNVVSGALTQIYGLTPTIILIRVAIGASYDNDTKMTRTIEFNTPPRTTRSTTSMGTIQSPIGEPQTKFQGAEKDTENKEGSSTGESI